MTRPSIAPTPRLFAAAALACFLIALLGFGAALPGYSHAMHPAALLGARGVPHWIGFDALGFVVPGLLAWWAHVRAGWQWQVGAVPMGRVAAIGWTMCTIAALAFAAQGVLAVDVTRGFGFGVGRLHTAMYMVWWIAFAAGAVLLAAGAGPTTPLRRARIGTLLAAIVVLAFALFVTVPGAPAMGQKIAFATWLAWLVAIVPATVAPRREAQLQG
jgi:hypothetical protein